MRIPLLLELAAEAVPDRIAIDGSEGALSYAALQARAQAFAASLAGSPAAHIGYLGVNAPALPVALFGAALAGLPFCPLNYRLPDETLRRLAARLAPALIVADEAMADRLAGIHGIEILPRDALWRLTETPADGFVPVEGSDIAVLLFTSGTSGEPKAALLRHENLTSYVFQTVEFLGADEDEAALVSVPPYHVAAVSALLTSVYNGRRIVQLESFQPEAWVDSARRFAVTHAMLVPTMLGRVLDVLETAQATLPSLRALAYGGGRMPLPVIRRALDLLPGVAFTNAYGLTETSSTLSILGPEDHDAARSGEEESLRRLGSVGRPVPGVAVEIRDPDGRVLAAGEPGEIWVRGEQVSGEYVGRKATDDAGWFPTRDLGWFDEAGYLFIDGRLDDVIVRGGENISPGEIEDVLRQHPAVADVAVIGAPDQEWGERIVAFAVAQGTIPAEAELQDWVRTRLRSTKAPQQIFFRDMLPYNETGKLLRRTLRDELAAG
ncbi:class I adenylate-forming enzyme family protein [Flavisphingomonas formosensis]|uniref:class I adenylate-forming enzyme family protein n=1 Tax=Flavisphingomonas formosensis TaxID=861534 RepID=UPI0012F8DAC9|nr:class I adenylate-forming enzyme family protein [Sphingomonas formosensis]